MEELELYCKKLRLGSEILEEFEEIEFTSKRQYLTEVLKRSYSNFETKRKNRRIKTFEKQGLFFIEF